jgi:hypothetical protein
LPHGSIQLGDLIDSIGGGDAERKISHPHVNPNWVGAVRGLGRGLGTAWSAIQPCSAGSRLRVSSRLTDVKVKIVADGADYQAILKISKNPLIKGVHQQPNIDAKSRSQRLRRLARKVLAAIPDRDWREYARGPLTSADSWN